jgi:hypothetical protein
MRDNGSRACVMDKDCRFGLMGEDTRDTTNMMLNMDLVYTHGQMGKGMKENGRMASKMGREFSLIPKMSPEMVFLKKEKL